MVDILDSVVKIFSCYNKDLNGVMTKRHVNDFLSKMESRVKATKDVYTVSDFYDLIVGIAQLEVTFSNSMVLGDIGDIVKSFFHLDYDSDGCISKDDLLKALTEIGVKPTIEDISIMHTRLDFRGNGCPSLREYTEAIIENSA